MSGHDERDWRRRLMDQRLEGRADADAQTELAEHWIVGWPRRRP